VFVQRNGSSQKFDIALRVWSQLSV
jgi:hypothetical protein